MAAVNLQPELQPGKERDPNLAVQMQKIADALNAIGTIVVGETAGLVTAVGAYNVYRLANAPISGTVAMYDAGKRISPSSFTVQGRNVTILTASVAGPTIFDYRYL